MAVADAEARGRWPKHVPVTLSRLAPEHKSESATRGVATCGAARGIANQVQVVPLRRVPEVFGEEGCAVFLVHIHDRDIGCRPVADDDDAPVGLADAVVWSGAG
jgi:hypothetical protein